VQCRETREDKLKEGNQKAAVRLLSGGVSEQAQEKTSKILLDDSLEAVNLHRVSVFLILGL
jgi:hypothetical protein